MTRGDDLQETAAAFYDDGIVPPKPEAEIAALQARLIQCTNERDSAVAKLAAMERLVTTAEAVLHDFGRFEHKVLDFPDLGRVKVWSPEKAIVNTSCMNELQQALLRLAQQAARG